MDEKKRKEIKMTLIQGDCLKVLPIMPSDSIDLIITDPPFGINKEGIKNDENTIVFENALIELNRILKPNSFFATFWSVGSLDKLFEIIKKKSCFNYRWIAINYINNGMVRGGLGFSRFNILVVFEKGKASLNEQKCDIYECSTSSQQRLQIEHPTPKNEKFITKYIEALSREGGTVLDCFNGSGASIVACKMAKRNCISIEIEPKYIEVCKKRLNWGSSLNPNIEWEFKEVI